MTMLFLAQGVPLLWSGDEAGNSQQGNNNAYCQDNRIGWINWKNTKDTAAKRKFLEKLAVFRKEHAVLSQMRPYQCCDYLSVGFPDMSYHGVNAWIPQIDYGKMDLGILYSGLYAPEGTCREDVYVAYNFYSDSIQIALPKLNKRRKWYLAMNSAAEDAFLEEPKLWEEQQYIKVEPQAICILVGK